MADKSFETVVDSNQSDGKSQSPQSNETIPTATAAIPAAAPVERGRFVLDLHNRDEDSVSSINDNAAENDNNNADSATAAPDSPKSFSSHEIFEDVEQPGEQISDQDIERLLGPLTSRRTGKDNHITNSLELDNSDRNEFRRKKPPKAFCPCCPSVVRRGPWPRLIAMTGNDGSVPSTQVGNMIVIFPRCFYLNGCGIMGPHWCGPICCLGILTGSTTYFVPKAYHNVGPMTVITCLLFYIVGVASLCLISCSDPGVVRSEGLPDGRVGKNSIAGTPSMNISAGKGWRYCDLCCLYQPPDAIHCPECNVCIEGYDHHCPWMGTCIGKKNFAPFMVFNITWLLYLLYAIIWVTFFGTSFSEGPTNSSADV